MSRPRKLASEATLRAEIADLERQLSLKKQQQRLVEKETYEKRLRAVGLLVESEGLLLASDAIILGILKAGKAEYSIESQDMLERNSLASNP